MDEACGGRGLETPRRTGRYNAASGAHSTRKAPRLPGGLSSAHEERVQLVAVEVAEVAGVEVVAARAGLAFVGAAERQRLLVDRIDLFLRLGCERDHHAVADRGLLAVVRLGQGDAGATAVAPDD